MLIHCLIWYLVGLLGDVFVLLSKIFNGKSKESYDLTVGELLMGLLFPLGGPVWAAFALIWLICMICLYLEDKGLFDKSVLHIDVEKDKTDKKKKPEVI